MTEYRWNLSDAASGYDQCAEEVHPFYLEIQDRILSQLADDPTATFTLLDAGGGSGRLIERALDRFPQAKAMILDQSEPFLALAERRLSRFGDRVTLHRSRLQDDWREQIARPCDRIVSMSAIHHLDAAEKMAFYARAYAALNAGGRLINGDEIRATDDDAYLAELRTWANHMRRMITQGRIPQPMHSTLQGWITRNVDRFGEPKFSGDDCHETAAAQLGYLRSAGFTECRELWQRAMWSVFQGVKP